MSHQNEHAQSGILKSLIQVRRFLARPLQVRLLPKWIPIVPLPVLRDLPFVTFGNVLLALPIVLVFFFGYSKTFVNPSISSSGYAAFVAILLVFLFANKSNSIFTFLFGMSFERLVPYHHLSAWVAIVLSVFHGYVAFDDGSSSTDSAANGSRELRAYSQYAIVGPQTNAWKFAWDGGTNLTGSIVVVCMFGLVASSAFRVVRKHFFDLWLILHVVCSVGVIVFCLAHAVIVAIFLLIWWVLDLMIRYVVQAGMDFPGRTVLTKITDDVVEIRLVGGNLHYEAGQFVKVAVPLIGALEFHPCTISSAPYEEDVTLHFKVLGGWAERLMELAEQKREISVLIEGPYGSLSMDLLENDLLYPIVVCVGGGIGITPCRSIARQIAYEERLQKRHLSKLHVIWTLRDKDLVSALPILQDQGHARDQTAESKSSRMNMLITQESSQNNADDVDIEVACATSDVELSVHHTDIYLTNVSSKDSSLEEIEESLASNTEIHAGRPDWEDVFSQLKEQALLQKESKRVAVVACGPASLVEQVKLLCHSHSKTVLEGSGVSFDFHQDIFAY